MPLSNSCMATRPSWATVFQNKLRPVPSILPPSLFSALWSLGGNITFSHFPLGKLFRKPDGPTQISRLANKSTEIINMSMCAWGFFSERDAIWSPFPHLEPPFLRMRSFSSPKMPISLIISGQYMYFGSLARGASNIYEPNCLFFCTEMKNKLQRRVMNR